MPSFAVTNRGITMAALLPRTGEPMGEPSLNKTLSETPLENRLDSWKEIATYLGRDVTTVQRWEKRERMPVHRHVHAKRGSVYALAPELDAWLRGRRQSLAAQQEESEPKPDATVESEGQDRGAAR